MGQMTDVLLGISVSLPLKYENMDLIIKLLNTDNVTLIISGLFEEKDEVINCDFDYTFDLDVLDELMDLYSEEMFKLKYKELDIKEDLIFHFMHGVAGIYARNLNFRSNPYLFSHDEHHTSPAKLILDIQKGIQIFKDAGIDEILIKVSNTIREG